MISRFFILFSFFIVIAFSCWGQSALRAKRHLEKDNLERVIKIVGKSIRRSPNDPANHFILSQYFVHPDFGFEAVDSANIYLTLAEEGWKELEEKDKNKFARKGMDSLSIQILSLKIDSLAYENAKILNTEQAYNHFLENYTEAIQREEVAELRNEVAYQNAVAKNSPEAMEEFFRKYPAAKQAKNAKDIYETLYFEKFTVNKTLESYVAYLEEKPESVHKDEAALQILKIISTAADSSLLKSFVKKYPDTQAAFTAQRLLTYWNDENLHSPLMVHFKAGQYYFFDTKEQKLLDFKLKDVEMDSCGWITSPLILRQNNKVRYDRLGNLFLDMPASSLEYLQSGFIKVLFPTQSKFSLIHISKDSLLTQTATDFKMVDSYYLSKKTEGKWQLISLLGEEILTDPVDSIWAINNTYFFKNNDRMALATKKDLSKNGKNDFKTLSLLYTEYKIQNNGSIWLASNEYQSVLSAELKPMIPLKKVQISKIPLGWVVQNEGELTILTNDFKDKMSLEAQKFKANNQVIALKSNEKWTLINQNTEFPEFVYDSVRLFSSWLTYAELDKRKILIFEKAIVYNLEEGETFKILKTYNEEVLNSEEQVRFVEVRNRKGYTKIYNGFGRKINEGENLKADALTASILQITSNESKILLDSIGNQLVTEKVDAYGSMQNGLIPILKNKKFGAFQIKNQQIIPFKSDVKLKLFSPDSLFIFQKDGKYGIMDAEGDEILKHEYQSISFLNDSMAFVGIEDGKMLININTKKELINGIQVLDKISFKETDFYLIRLSSGYGIINSAAQELIPFIFNAIEPIKSSNQLMWKAERRISEMDYQVVAYFNAMGKLLFREGFTDEEYLKTACD